MKATRLSLFCMAVLLLACVFAIAQQTSQQDDSTIKKIDNSKKKDTKPPETVARPMTDKERKAKEKQLRKELATPYRKWLNEDVVYIITDEERSAFMRLQTDEEREQFIENFWLRRDPTPDTVENEFREEHYRRIAYANEHFASGIPGWKTDRGRIYITYGPPDEIDDHSSGGTYERPPEEGGGETSTYPFQQWRYRYIEGIGTNIIIEFVDPTMSGEFHMTMDPSEKDALLYVPNAGLTIMEQMGMSDKTQRFNNTDGTHLAAPMGGLPESMNEFSRLEQYAKLQKPPAIKYADLEAKVDSRILYDILPMKVRVDFFPVTDASVMTYVTVQYDNKDLQLKTKDGVATANVHLFGEFRTISGRIVQTFEEDLQIPGGPEQYRTDWQQRKSIGQKEVPLKPGVYRLDVVSKDVTSGFANNYQTTVNVPRIDPDTLSTSTLILADDLENVPLRNIGTGQFVIGDTKVRPRLGSTFRRDETLGIFMKLYNFATTEQSRKPQGEIQYEVFKTGTAEPIVAATDDIGKLPDASAAQVTLQKRLRLEQFAPGSYTLKIKITDKNRNQTLTQSAPFTVT
ncbi:MAG TPA: GWxTD domain-containing protein [Bryobacteraceae bacterium]|nr:GWxTD domain-containing protein [Bryobacteraceae bacterium]